jgi:two-component system response regulator AtoC
MSLSILLVEDDRAFAEHLSRFLKKEGHDVELADTGEKGMALFHEKTPDLVLLDLLLPDLGGLEVLEQLKSVEDSVTVIVITAHGSIDTAVDAMRLGARDYLTKPIDLDALSVKLEQTEEILGLRSDFNYLLDRERRSAGFESFVGNCPQMREVYDKIRDVAKTDNTTVLITGPSGTGKELVAKAIHSLSKRNKKPLMEINCTAIPLSLMESELFGHERGAFTGADRMKKGLLELADGGTLMLDEIGDMDLSLQAKLLRVLQERQFRRVGGTRDLRFDVRVIAATNQDLDQMSEEKTFRNDLLYRLKVFQIDLPSLKERGKDIIEIAQSFISEYASNFRKPVKGLDDEARQLLLDYSFPGNVRELQNIIEQAVILSKGEFIAIGHLSISKQAAAASTQGETEGEGSLSLDALGDLPLQNAERYLIAQALNRSNGNKKRAAELLGISRFALQRKLEKFALDALQMNKS